MRSPPFERGCRPTTGSADPVRGARNAPPPPRGATGGLCRKLLVCVCAVGLFAMTPGCKSASVNEVRGKTSFGPEIRHRGTNTDEVRYDARQNIELRWDNGWTSGLTYRNRAVDQGSGDNEHLFLFEVGYPIWKAPKKPEKTTERFEELEREVAELRARLAEVTGPSPNSGVASASSKP